MLNSATELEIEFGKIIFIIIRFIKYYLDCFAKKSPSLVMKNKRHEQINHQQS